MEEERCQCPEDEVNITELNVCCTLHFGLPIHTVCGKRRSIMSRSLGIGGFSRGVESKPLNLYTPYSISMLRQWLNEDRITEPSKMVTNEMIEKWLNLEPPDNKE